jgi:tRNA threonylcarbamoyladenosine biosynthesis protein TsaE
LDEGAAVMAHSQQDECGIIEALQRYLPDPAATARAGALLAPGLRGGMVVTLSGELGVGKTTLVRGLLRALGWTGPVKSPSYALVEHYPISSLYFYHFDFYRLNDATEWDTTGFAELFRPDTVGLIEWPEHVAGRVPVVDVAVQLRHAEPGRVLLCDAGTAAGRACLDAFSSPVQ